MAGSSNDSDSDSYRDLDIYTEEELRFKGLKLLGWKDNQISRVTADTANERFRADFGPNPHVAAQIWEDLQTKGEDPVNYTIYPVEDFLYALNFLRVYPTEIQRENRWHHCANYLRPRCWYMIEKIASHKQWKITWPDDNFGTDIWAMSVDGVHFRTEEPSHPEWPKDPSYFTYKHHCAGFNYEIGLSLRDSRCHWINGPYKAGAYNDIKIFRECGLRDKLRATGKKVIADSGYQGYPDLISRYNSLDSEEVREFKTRARMRHEAFNGMCKVFECLDSEFRHEKEQLQVCFEAVAVIVCYQMEMGSPLYDI